MAQHQEQELIALSDRKWRWMAERDVEKLDRLFDPQAVFVHMGATMTKAEELDVTSSTNEPTSRTCRCVSSARPRSC
jgi:acetoin utilization deacetylase AcuC-like enzyme